MHNWTCEQLRFRYIRLDNIIQYEKIDMIYIYDISIQGGWNES